MDTIQFEAIKLSLKQDRSGYALHLAIHPDEIPDALVRDFVGARYQVVMVRLNEHEQLSPVNPVTKAAMLAKDTQFQTFLFDSDLVFETSQAAAEQAIRDVCGVRSRAELNASPEARKAFTDLLSQYEEWKHGPN